jgi:hypothetical protein
VRRSAITFTLSGTSRNSEVHAIDGYRVTVYERDQPLFWPPKG